MPVWGSWDIASYDSKVVAIHACLLHTGKVLFFAGRSYPVWSRLYDPSNNSLSETIPVPVWPDEPYSGTEKIEPSAIFCSGHVFLQDGMLLVAGGEMHRPYPNDWYSIENQPFRGLKYTFYFNPSSEQWEVAGPSNNRFLMFNGRWYPTLVLLENGEVIAMSGWSDEGYFLINDVPEKFKPGFLTTDGWTRFTNQEAIMPLTSLYPAATIIPFGTHAGKIFYSFPDAQSYIFNPVATGGITSPFWESAALPRANPNFTGISILLPLKHNSSDMKIILAGGEFQGNALEEVYLINLNDSNPQWQIIDPLNYKRYHHNAVVLPDANILIVGGNTQNAALGSVLTPELFDTETMAWSGFTLPDMTVARNYHSTALLLPNGKVWVAGGRVYNGGDVEDDTEKRIEIFTPGYLADGDQPTIENYPAEITYDTEYDISVSGVEALDSIVMIKPASTTHGIDMDQRFIGLSFNSFGTPGSGTYKFRTPLNSKIAPPGYYMLFILKPKSESNSGLNKIPSEAVFVHIM